MFPHLFEVVHSHKPCYGPPTGVNGTGVKVGVGGGMFVGDTSAVIVTIGVAPQTVGTARPGQVAKTATLGVACNVST